MAGSVRRRTVAAIARVARPRTAPTVGVALAGALLLALAGPAKASAPCTAARSTTSTPAGASPASATPAAAPTPDRRAGPRARAASRRRSTPRDFGTGDPHTLHAHGLCSPSQVGSAHCDCPDGPSDDLCLQLGHGFASQAHPWDPGTQGMTGTETQDAGSVIIKHEWDLSRKAVGP